MPIAHTNKKINRKKYDDLFVLVYSVLYRLIYGGMWTTINSETQNRFFFHLLFALLCAWPRWKKPRVWVFVFPLIEMDLAFGNQSRKSESVVAWIRKQHVHEICQAFLRFCCFCLMFRFLFISSLLFLLTKCRFKPNIFNGYCTSFPFNNFSRPIFNQPTTG